ncbi:hypothetical protein JXVLWARM_CDS_0026 [Burkholderia phage Bm1]
MIGHREICSLHEHILPRLDRIRQGVVSRNCLA